MRLIDADKLRFRHTVKCNSDTTRPYTLNCISFDEVQNAPTIKAVPIDVLDKIREEIEKLQKSCDVAQDMFKESQEMVYCYKAFKQAYTKVIGIIDKYRNEVDE